MGGREGGWELGGRGRAGDGLRYSQIFLFHIRRLTARSGTKISSRAMEARRAGAEG